MTVPYEEVGPKLEEQYYRTFHATKNIKHYILREFWVSNMAIVPVTVAELSKA
jgi:hypothetical protein